MTLALICYYAAAAGLLLFQVLILLEAGRHFNYVRRKWPPKRSSYRPTAALIVPCKGLESAFEQNIRALFDQDYEAYRIYFVLESESDPACEPLRRIIGEQADRGVEAELIFAGKAQGNSQKVHNLLTACRQIPTSIEAWVFVDADACPARHFVGSMVHPLRREEVGASTGYRWYVPTDWRLSSQVLSTMNAYFASMLGPHGRNPVWGGAMAFKRSFFYEAGIDQLWQGALSDDYAVSHAVKAMGLEAYFVPACFVASYEGYGWNELAEFTRRQFIITWRCARGLWILAASGFGQYVLGFWAGLAVSIALWVQGNPQARWAAILPAGLYLSSVLKALMRQSMIFRILAGQRKRLIVPAILDLAAQPLVAIWTWGCILSTWGQDTICWRGNRYRIEGIDKTVLLSAEDEAKVE